ncbi:tumor suppressor candidate 2-like [Plakobranchus ocellatus]|uniref:Tumor suppressor candidate 2-like n=1 Tax=Plakobranchus ocellatus TaxID=259542 RepID=A0AAV3Z0U2_9GAST|nr:tumor suppressor candidate 2-like [Plakobranchus ocellatus]
MGQSVSNVSKYVSNSISWMRGSDERRGSGRDLIPRGATIFVFKRRGSMYFDEDGDLAHEFYCEVTDRKTNKVVMRRVFDNLVPQGEVDLPHPRLHVDLPVIVFDTSMAPGGHSYASQSPSS